VVQRITAFWTFGVWDLHICLHSHIFQRK